MAEDTRNKRMRRMDRRRKEQPETQLPPAEDLPVIERSEESKRPVRIDLPRTPEEVLPPYLGRHAAPEGKKSRISPGDIKELIMTFALAALTGFLSLRAGMAKACIPGAENILPGNFWAWCLWGGTLLTASRLAVVMLRHRVRLFPALTLWLAESLLLNGHGIWLSLAGMFWLLGALAWRAFGRIPDRFP